MEAICAILDYVCVLQISCQKLYTSLLRIALQ